MREDSVNHYERAFENWLIDSQVDYVRADEHKRIGAAGQSVKNFDFLIYTRSGRRIIAEVKGRTFRGTSLVGLKGLECWVTRDDVAGLLIWQEVLGENHEAVFVFAYRLAQIDVDLDGREAFCFGADRYVFFSVRVADYARAMKRRSPKWQTVTLPAKAFRQYARELASLLQ